MVVKLDISKAGAGAVKVDTYKTKPSGIELAPNYSHEQPTSPMEKELEAPPMMEAVTIISSFQENSVTVLPPIISSPKNAIDWRIRGQLERS
jgi:hypothetical protein